MKTILLYIVVVLGLSAAGYGFWYQQHELSDLRTQVRILNYNEQFLERKTRILDAHADQLLDNQHAFDRVLRRLNSNQQVLVETMKQVIKAVNGAHGGYSSGRL